MNISTKVLVGAFALTSVQGLELGQESSLPAWLAAFISEDAAAQQAAEDAAAAANVEQDCSCQPQHGLDIYWTEEGVHYIELTDFEGTTHQFPPDYGTSCKAWDELLPYCADDEGIALDDAHEFCTQSWCWVNPDTCDSGMQSFGDHNLWYTYEDACPVVEEEEPEVEEEEIEEEEEEEMEEEVIEEDEEPEQLHGNGADFSNVDLNQNGVNDVDEFEGDCSCLTQHGVPVYWTEEGVHYIEFGEF